MSPNESSIFLFYILIPSQVILTFPFFFFLRGWKKGGIFFFFDSEAVTGQIYLNVMGIEEKLKIGKTASRQSVNKTQ